jgi:hypothetical protein
MKRIYSSHFIPPPRIAKVYIYIYIYMLLGILHHTWRMNSWSDTSASSFSMGIVVKISPANISHKTSHHSFFPLNIGFVTPAMYLTYIYIYIYIYRLKCRFSCTMSRQLCCIINFRNHLRRHFIFVLFCQYNYAYPGTDKNSRSVKFAYGNWRCKIPQSGGETIALMAKTYLQTSPAGKL